jgi:N-acetylmuramoyl-L-alanine amidase
MFDVDLTRIGYDPDIPLETRLRVFRLHFRPAGAGILDAVDCAIVKAIADKFQLT